MAAATDVGRRPRDRRQTPMPSDIVLLNIVIALGIMALAARFADGRK
jgi:hypothetical protein